MTTRSKIRIAFSAAALALSNAGIWTNPEFTTSARLGLSALSCTLIAIALFIAEFGP